MLSKPDSTRFSPAWPAALSFARLSSLKLQMALAKLFSSSAGGAEAVLRERKVFASADVALGLLAEMDVMLLIAISWEMTSKY